MSYFSEEFVRQIQINNLCVFLIHKIWPIRIICSAVCLLLSAGSEDWAIE